MKRGIVLKFPLPYQSSSKVKFYPACNDATLKSRDVKLIGECELWPLSTRIGKYRVVNCFYSTSIPATNLRNDLRGNHSEKKDTSGCHWKTCLAIDEYLANLFINTFWELNLFRDTISWWEGDLRKTSLRSFEIIYIFLEDDLKFFLRKIRLRKNRGGEFWVVLRNTEKLRGNGNVCGKMENITTGSMQVTDLKKNWGTRLYILNY